MTFKRLLALLVVVEVLPFVLFFGLIGGAAKEIADGFHRALRFFHRAPTA